MTFLHWIRVIPLLFIPVLGGWSGLLATEGEEEGEEETKYADTAGLPTDIPPKSTTDVYRAYCYSRDSVEEPFTLQESCDEIWFYNSYVLTTSEVLNHFHIDFRRTKGQRSPTREELKKNSNLPADSISLLSSDENFPKRFDVNYLADARVGTYNNSKGFPFRIKTSYVGQKEFMTACNGQQPPPWASQISCRTHDFNVKYPGLENYRPTITTSPLMTPWGKTTAHKNNHYGSMTLRNAIGNVVSDYYKEFGCYKPVAGRHRGWQKVGINDMSLPYGGIFDLNKNWKGPHFSHHKGNAVDIRCKPNASNSVIYDNDQPLTEQRIIIRFLEFCDDRGLDYKQFEYETDKVTGEITNHHCHCATSSSGE